MTLLRNMHVFSKQVMIIAVLLLPLIGTGVLLVRAENASIVDSAIKADGYRFNQPLEEVNSGLAQHMASAAAVQLGDESALGELREAQNHVDEAFHEAKEFVTEGGAEFGVDEALADLQAEWEQVKAQAPKLAYEESLRRHEQLFKDLQEINEQAIDSGRMRLADDVEIYYLADVSTQRIFETERAIGRLVAALAQASATQKATPEQRTHIAMLSGSMSAVVADIEDDLTTATAGNAHSADLRGKIAPNLTELTGAAAAFEQLIRAKVLDSAQVELSRAEANAAAKRALDAIDELHDVVQPSLVETQKARMHGERVQRLLQIAGIVTLTALAVWLAFVITRLITRPLRYAVRVFGKIATGDFTSRIDVRGTDEPNQVLLALDGMQSKLRAQIESERASAAENARIRSALDKSGSNVMLVDERLDIIYLNEAAQRLFREAQADLRKAIPSLDADRLEGTNVATLLRTLPELMQALDGLAQQRIADGHIGARAMRVCANPVRAADGHRMGTVIEWIDRTQEVHAEEELGAVVKGALQGDLTLRVKQAGKTGFFATLAGGLNPLLDNVADVIKRIKAASQDVYRGAQEISAGNANLSSRTEEQSSSLEETASSMEEMTSTVRQNADNAAQANQLAMAARANAEKGGAVVQEAVRAMDAINDSSRKIADIIGVIDEIAFQTNLLALNAAVEAARAGEQGRGFAVVASEVRSLAGRSAGAAKEIKALIQDSVARVGEGSALVGQSGETLAQIIAAVKKVSDVVAEIAAASREQSSGIEQVTRAVTGMDQMTQQNAALVEEASAASESMSQQARELSEAVSRYRIDGNDAVIPLSAPIRTSKAA